MYNYDAIVRRVVDADTIIVDIDLGFQIWLFNISLRLWGVDAYEMRGPEREKGLKAREYVEDMINAHNGQITITTSQKDSFGRWIAKIVIGGMDLSADLVNQGHAHWVEKWKT